MKVLVWMAPVPERYTQMVDSIQVHAQNVTLLGPKDVQNNTLSLTVSRTKSHIIAQTLEDA